jgi:eukaryotic-like serine/threonine-protein kinase
MRLVAGDKLGPYEIQSAIGAGGMGEVYKARDTRLNRTVAVKVLPSHIAGREDLKQRFEREARAVSSLNHPHICVLFDIGQRDGVDFMVMEHLEGETLASPLRKGPLPLDQVLKYALQIADAVDRAHRTGVVHRDLKPANIMITRDGVKVLDFGLAKTAPKSAPDGVTLTKALTSEGIILGTPQYMSPEQIQGSDVDARTDIFAFGCVLYEMATGKRAFDGKTRASVIGAILSTEPPILSGVPPALEILVRRCLAKDPEDRYQCMRDLALDLHTAGHKPPATQLGTRRWLWAACASLAATLVVLAGWLVRPSEQLTRHYLSITPPPGHHFQRRVGEEGGTAISPDGSMLAFIALGKTGVQQFWVRRMDDGQARPLAGTERARHPFWSPDSRSLGFFADGKLKRIDVSGGTAQTLCDAPNERGGAWSNDGIILFGSMGAGIQRVPASGGPPAPATRLPSQGFASHLWPSFLPDGRQFLYASITGFAEQNGIYAASLDTPGATKRLVALPSNAVYVGTRQGSHLFPSEEGYLLFHREGALVAQRFLPGRLDLVGESFPIAQRIQFTPASMSGDFTVSRNGTLVYDAGAGNQYQLTWRDRSGRKLGTIGEPDAVSFPALSKDGKRLALRRIDPTGNYDIWIAELNRSTMTRFTFETSIDSFPAWSPDGSWLAFSSSSAGIFTVKRKPASGVGEPEALTEGSYVSEWSSDGRYLLLYDSSQTGFDIQVLPLAGERKRKTLVGSRFDETHPRLSSDGRWLAYVSDDSGTREVYVQRFDPDRPSSERSQVSLSGGSEPRWRENSAELYYLSLDGKMMAAAVQTRGGHFEAAAPKPLFETPADSSSNIIWYYDVTQDGQRFIIAEPVAGGETRTLTVLINWQAGLKK